MNKILIIIVGSLLLAYIIVSLISTKPKKDIKEHSKKLLENYNKETLDIYLLIQEGKNNEALESLINYVVKNK
jgi:ABC-type transport system involved in cytochrome bd biosynthesis fused ATPase/permease subunit